ncbi:MAG TPA: hypothetical protein VLF91_01825 [Candidatus Saccharimonadales bacterium]|nr:hypothetical protein [Candidatus Saccharimonadales bacterium]
MNPNAYNQPGAVPTPPPGVPYVPAQVMPSVPTPGAPTPPPGFGMPNAAVPHSFAADMIHQPTFQEVQAQAAAPPAPLTGAPTTAAAGVQPAVKPAVHNNPNSTQNSLLIAEIRDGIVVMNDGSFRSVVMVKSVNFDLMSPQEQEAVEYSYQGFLNSLYFPIQIFIRSQKVDLQPYIEKLDKIRTEHDNMLLAMLMDDYINYIDQLSQQTNIMDKKFYVVIPYFPHVDVQKAITQSKNFFTGLAGLFNSKEQHIVINEGELAQAKTELRNRVQAVLQGLLQAGVQGLPLDTQELIELYYDTYNPDTATRQQLKNFNDLSTDVVTKGQGYVTQSHLQRELGQ